MPLLHKMNNPFKIVLVTAFFAAMGWAIYLYRIPVKDSLWNYLYNVMNAVIYLIGGAAGIYYSISPRMTQDLRKALMFYGTGMVAWSLASLLWCYFNIFLKTDIPYPSANDFFFILFMILVSVGSIYLMRHFSIRITRRNALESAIIIMFTYIAVFFFIAPPEISLDLPIVTVMFNVIYPLSDAFMFSLGLVIFHASEKHLTQSVRYLVMGLLLQAVGDFVFGYLTSTGTYWNGDIADLIYTVSGFLLSAGIISLATRTIATTKHTNF